MWLPQTYADVQNAIGVLSEGPDLDFKLDHTKPADLKGLAKDVAAMSLEGGVIVIGIDETAGEATALVTFPIANRPEQIQQVIDANVRPTPSTTVEAVRRQAGDSDGVIVITVAPSRQAPHMVDGRFPARSGATTRYYDEHEIAELYRRRDAIRAVTDRQTGLEDFTGPRDGAEPPQQGVGRLRLRVRPVMPLAHPDEPQLRTALLRAVTNASVSLQSLVKPEYVSAFDLLRDWKPRGAVGWQAGLAPTTDASLGSNSKLVAGTYIYEQGFSFQVVMGLAVYQQDWLCAYEHLWAAQTMALLAIAGHFYATMPSASPLRCDFELVGLSGALSFQASQGRMRDLDAPIVEDALYLAGGEITAREASIDPRAGTHMLLDRLLASIIPEQVDLIDRLAPRSLEN
jgi:hypothetical protein